ncbi:MAG TPA: HD domain-containing phosphohydrolase [Phycisphaerales bacterium]
MVIALPVLHPRRPEVILLRPGAEIDAHTIAKMREIGLREVWVKYPRLAHLSEYISPQIVTACSELAGQVGRALDSVMNTAHARLDYSSYRRAVSSLIEKFCEHPKAALYVTEIGESGSAALRHASNVCLLSVLMGLKLDFYLVHERPRLPASVAKDVANLGVGAMLHDVGMVRLPPAARARWDATQDETDPAFREHVQIGFNLIHEQIEPSAAAIVLHHHQAYDGSGFPTRKDANGVEVGLKGSEIHVFARIVAAADLFCRIRNNGREEGEPAMPTVRALKLIQEPRHAARIDPMVLRALFNVVPAYAPGSIVMLSNGHECVVTRWNHESPCRPVVETLVPAGKNADPVEFDLRTRKDLTIARADGFAVGNDNFDLKPGEFDLHSGAEALLNRAVAMAERRKAS